MKIEVFSDFTCPFCYIGKRELERAIEQLRREEPEKKRLCWGLGILGGLFLAVVLM